MLQSFTFYGVRDRLRSLKNLTAAGCDGIPAELLKYRGGTGIQVVAHLLNAVVATRCVRIPSAWRQGSVVHLLKGCDTGLGDCFSYGMLTLLPVVGKPFTNLKLLPKRVARAVNVNVNVNNLLLCARTTSSMRSAPAWERSTRYRTCWRRCGNAAMATQPWQHSHVCLLFRCGNSLQHVVSNTRSSAPRPPSVRRHGSRLRSSGGCVLVGIQQGACCVSSVPSLCSATWGCTRVPTVPAVTCRLHRPCIAGHADPVTPRPAVGGTGCLTTKVSGSGLR